MSEASFASLNPALLARKGGAKPAMRPQVAPMVQDPAEMASLADEALEDLGWNDMGGDESPDDDHEGGNIVPITGKVAGDSPVTVDSPIVHRQQKDLADRVLADAAMPSVQETIKPAKQASNRKSGKRAAFTLRLDTERHLKLRLASTIQGVSAQALVTEALDALLDQFEELDALAQRMKRD